MLGKSSIVLCLASSLGLIVLGCSKNPGRVSAPRVDAQHAAQLALEELDGNGDGILQREELESCPALVHALSVYDTDGDGQLSQSEIEAGINRWASARTGAVVLPFRLQLDGRPLAGAQVRLVPVSYMPNTIKSAVGSADVHGAGTLGLSPEDLPANAPRMPMVPPGLYRVEITHPDKDIPSKFNSQTELGLETSVAALNPAGVIWNLSTK